MKIILNLSQVQELFQHDYTDYAYAMLPIADKPILAYHLDRLVEQGYKTIYLLVSNTTKESVSLIGNGDYWSVQITYLNIQDSSDRQILGDLKRTHVAEIDLQHGLSLDEQDCTLKSYLSDNFMVISQRQKYQLESFEIKQNMYLSEGATCQSSTDFLLHMGRFSLVKSCLFRGTAVIGENSTIAQGTILDNTVVMPNTQVGSNLDISNCLVTPQWIYHQITDQCIEIGSSELLSTA